MPGYAYKEINVPNYTLSNDEFLGIEYTKTGTVILTLPDIEEVGAKCYIITDVGGNASLNYITIDAVNGQKINGTPTKMITESYKSLTLFNDYNPSSENFNWYVSAETF